MDMVIFNTLTVIAIYSLLDMAVDKCTEKSITERILGVFIKKDIKNE